MVSVIVPTISERATFLAACKAAYAAHTEAEHEVIVIRDKSVCGAAWVEGAQKATGDFIHFSADDLCPLPGWDVAAIGVCERGYLPAPRILNDDGTLQSCGGTDGWETELPTGQETDFSRIPFLSREQWDRISDMVTPFLQQTHYFTDNAIGWCANLLGIPTGVHRDYLFTHSLAEPGRGAGTSWENRMILDGQVFSRFVGEVWPSGA